MNRNREIYLSIGMIMKLKVKNIIVFLLVLSKGKLKNVERLGEINTCSFYFLNFWVFSDKIK